jgi:hypothetical protein
VGLAICGVFYCRRNSLTWLVLPGQQMRWMKYWTVFAFFTVLEVPLDLVVSWWVWVSWFVVFFGNDKRGRFVLTYAPLGCPFTMKSSSSLSSI